MPPIHLRVFLVLLAAGGLLIVIVRYFDFRHSFDLINVGGHRLRISCYGEGSPAVILDAGLADGMETWDQVTPEIAKFTRVCAYDRAGTGGSDDARMQRTSQQIVNELNVLLEKSKVPAPYILVGHSFGGLNVRLYASQHQEKVAGLVLVDASHENQTLQYANMMERERSDAFLRYANGKNPEHVDVIASSDQVRASAPIPKVPLIVITAEYEEWLPKTLQVERLRQKLQSQLAQLVPETVHLRAKGSGHFIQRDRPDIVIRAVQDVLARTRVRHVHQSK